MKNQSFILVLLFSICIPSFIALASSTKSGQSIVIAEEVNEDLYLAAGSIIVSAPVNGDLLAAGGDILVQNSIEEDVIVMGGTVKILGTIGDDLRVMGGTVNIQDVIEGDLIVAGGEVTVGKNAIINGTIKAAAGEIAIEGTVAGPCTIRADQFEFTGTALNNFSAKAREMTIDGSIKGLSELSAPELEIGQNAIFYSNVEYWNRNNPVNFDAALANGAIANQNPDMQIHQSENYSQYFGAGMFAFLIYRIIVAIIFIGLLIWAFHKFFASSSIEVSKNYFEHLGIGLLYVIGIPVLIGVLFLTVIGIPIGLIVTMAYALSIALGTILAAILATYGYNNYYQKGWSRRKIFGISILVYLTFKLITAIPFIGVLVSIILLMMVFGTLISYWWNTSKNRRELSVS